MSGCVFDVQMWDLSCQPCREAMEGKEALRKPPSPPMPEHQNITIPLEHQIAGSKV